MSVRLVCIIALALPYVALASGDASPKPDPKQIEQGRMLYEIYCQSCHGEEADGRGEAVASMTPRPVDLTRLRAADGTFPADQIHRSIDGREPVPGHARKKMPIWGLTMQELDSDADQEDEVRNKIRSIVHYLESIQRPGRKPKAP